MNLRDTAKGESQMAIVREEAGLDIGDFTGQPLSMGKGNHSVVFAVHEQNRNSNLTQFETPGRHECELIIDIAVPSLADSLPNTAEHEIGKVGG